MKTSSVKSPSRQPGLVVTFYSYKGGVGRSTAVANIAVLLARMGKKVLVVDWDLEAPGLHHYLIRCNPTKPRRQGGLLALLESAKAPRDRTRKPRLPHWRDHLIHLPAKALQDSKASSEIVAVHLLPSGVGSRDYAHRLSSFSWENFYAKDRGGDFIEALRESWVAEYDFILIDARTGLTDASGVCTIQMPDVLVPVFAANRQNLDGVVQVAKSAQTERAQLHYQRAWLLILPILSRFDAEKEVKLADKWFGEAIKAIKFAYRDWLPKDFDPRQALKRTTIPYIAYYSFGEELAVIDEDTANLKPLTELYRVIAELLAGRFQKAARILDPEAAARADLPDLGELAKLIKADPKYALERAAMLLSGEDDVFEHDAPTRLRMLETLADTCRDQRRYREAAAILDQAGSFALKTPEFKAEEAPRLQAKHALVLMDAGEFTEAELLLTKAIEQEEKLYGPNDARLAGHLADLATLLERLQRRPQAYALLLRAFDLLKGAEVKETALLSDIARRTTNMADYFGLYRQAEIAADELLRLIEREEPANSNAHSFALDRKGWALWRQGCYIEAEPLFRRALAGYEKALGPEHPDVGITCGNLAHLLEQRERYGEAEALYRRALAVNEKTFGPGHPRLAAAYGDLGNVLRLRGRYKEAEELFLRALGIAEKTLGFDHHLTAVACGNVANVLRAQGRYAEAHPFYERALTVLKKILGPEHPDVAVACGNFAGVLAEQKRYSEAETLFREALTITEKALGPEHPRVATDCGGLGSVVRDQGRYAEAETLYRRALEVHQKALGSEHSKVAVDSYQLGFVLTSLNRLAEAEPFLRQAITKLKKSKNLRLPTLGRARWRLAQWLEASDRFEEALIEGQAALEIVSKALGETHPHTIEMLQWLTSLKHADGQAHQSKSKTG